MNDTEPVDPTSTASPTPARTLMSPLGWGGDPGSQDPASAPAGPLRPRGAGGAGRMSANGDPVDPLAFRPDAAARVIGISRSALYMELASGRLPSIKIGRSRLITRAALDAFLTEREGSAQ